MWGGTGERANPGSALEHFSDSKELLDVPHSEDYIRACV